MNIKNGSWDNLKPRSDNRAFYFPRIAVKPYGIWKVTQEGLRGLFAKQVGRKRRKGSNPLLSAKTN